MRLNLFTTLVLAVGCFWIYDGLHRGFRYYPLMKQAPEKFTVSEVTNLNGRIILPEFVAVGSISNVQSPVIIEIFESQFQKLKPGDSVTVYHIISPRRTEWVNGEKIEESKPLMNIFGLHFSWHFIAGLLMAAYACGSAWLRRRQLNELITLLNKRSSPEDSGGAPPRHPAK